MLLKKQAITDNEIWLQAIEECTKQYSRESIKKLEAETISMIHRVASRYSNICSGWIAGKDSLALDHLLRKSGIQYTPIMWRGINEYPAVARWIDENKPRNMIEEIIDKYTLEFIEAHPDYLFCRGNTRNKWMATKWQRYKKDIPKHGFDLFIAGRRLKDGNICGSKADDYVRVKEFATFSPMAEWNHEQLLAYIKYENIDLPPFYSWERGFLLGSVAMGEWTERPALNLTDEQVWAELYRIDPSIVLNAAKVLTSARKYINMT